MNNIPIWLKQGYLDPKDYEIDQTAEFLKNNPWEKVLERKDIFEEIVYAKEWSAADKVKLDRTIALGELFQDIRKIPSQDYTYLLMKFANTDTNQIDQFKTAIKEFYSEVEFKDAANLSELHERAKKIANGLANIHRIAFYKTAEENFPDILALKDHSTEKINELWEKTKNLDRKLAQNIKNKQPTSKEDLAGLTELLKNAGRINLEIEDLRVEEQRYIVIVLNRIIESLTIVRQAQKDKTTDQLANLKGVVAILERIQDEDIQRFFEYANKAGGMKTPVQNIGSNVGGNVSGAV